MKHIYFAVPHTMPTAEREQVPARIARRFNNYHHGRIEFVRHDQDWRLYRMHPTGTPAVDVQEEPQPEILPGDGRGLALFREAMVRLGEMGGIRL